MLRHEGQHFTTPYFCLQPATNTSDLIVADMPLLARTDRQMAFSGTLRRTIFSTTPLEQAFLFLRAAPGSHTAVTIGGQHIRLEGNAHGYAEAACDRLRPRLPRLRMGYLYRFAASAGPDPVLLYMAFRPEEAMAVRHCLTNPGDQPHLTDADFFRTYGVSKAYIDALTR